LLTKFRKLHRVSFILIEAKDFNDGSSIANLVSINEGSAINHRLFSKKFLVKNC